MTNTKETTCLAQTYKYCTICGEEYIPRATNQKYCSLVCRTNYYEKQRNPRHQKIVLLTRKNCVLCGRVFLPKQPTQRFCKVECNRKHHKKKYEMALINGTSEHYLKLRFEAFKRDNFTCQYCGRTAQDSVRLVADHIIPRSKGGKDNLNNLITACEECNLGKSDVVLKKHQEKKFKRIAEKKHTKDAL